MDDIVKLERAKNRYYQRWRKSNITNFELKSQNDILAARVEELEALLWAALDIGDRMARFMDNKPEYTADYKGDWAIVDDKIKQALEVNDG